MDEASTLYVIDDVVVIGILFIVLALLVLLGGSITALWRSAPGWMGSLVQSQVDGILKIAADFAAKTPNTLDDEMVKAIQTIIAKELLALQPLQPVRIAPSILEADAAIYGGDNHANGDNLTGDPVPAGG